MTAVQLGGDLHREFEAAPGGLNLLRLRNSPHEVSAQPNKSFDMPFDHAFTGLNGVETLLTGCFEAVSLLQLIQRRELGFFRDADGSLSLHVGVPAYRTN